MPVYPYRCYKCGKQFEVRQSFDDPPLTEHEGCGGDVERELTAPVLQFKGTGFYATDYKRPATKSNKA
ncbi:MAG TPA: FmdB family zinc ribbon protein [Bryobacteraceae bacterium]|jgi:putative FmdB family regulatory protein|nr:FmdB family zinc ribbon protein [Bryobacteraceae bacterium]